MAENDEAPELPDDIGIADDEDEQAGSEVQQGDSTRIKREANARPCFSHKSHFGVLGEGDKTPTALRRLHERLIAEGHEDAALDVTAYCEKHEIDILG